MYPNLGRLWEIIDRLKVSSIGLYQVLSVIIGALQYFDPPPLQLPTPK
jgi:hypothetical protein